MCLITLKLFIYKILLNCQYYDMCVRIMVLPLKGHTKIKMLILVDLILFYFIKCKLVYGSF